MRIRDQIIVALVALFAGLSLVTGGVMYYLQIRELEWGLQEEASSIAIVAARFLDGTEVSKTTAGNPVDAVRRLADKIMKPGLARRITLLDPKDSRQLLDVAYSNSVSGEIQVDPVIAARLEKTYFVSGPVKRGKNDSDYLTTYAAVRDTGGGVSGIVTVETGADALRSSHDRLRQSLFVSLAGSVLLGLVLSLVISGLIARRLNWLARAATAVESGLYDEQLPHGIIDELNDLGNTFDTMRSILKESVSRIWRTVIEAEQFRASEDLACEFRKEFLAPVTKTIRGIEAAGALPGCLPDACFFGIWETKDGGCAVTGKVAVSGVMEQTKAASAVLAFIRQATEKGDVRNALESASGLFELEMCRCITWESAGKDGTMWTFDARSSRWDKESVSFRKGPVIIHSMDSLVDRRMRTYADEFRNLPAETLLGEIRLVAGNDASDSILILRPVATSKPGSLP